MIGRLKSFANGYRAVDIRILRGTAGCGWVATIVRDGKVLGEAMDQGDGVPVCYRFDADEEMLFLAYSKSIYSWKDFRHDERFLRQLVSHELYLKSLRGVIHGASERRRAAVLSCIESDPTGGN